MSSSVQTQTIYSSDNSENLAVRFGVLQHLNLRAEGEPVVLSTFRHSGDEAAYCPSSATSSTVHTDGEFTFCSLDS